MVKISEVTPKTGLTALFILNAPFDLIDGGHRGAFAQDHAGLSPILDQSELATGGRPLIQFPATKGHFCFGYETL